MLIDIYVHIARNHSAPGPGERYYPTPEKMLEFMDEAGIDMAVVMVRVSPECGIRLVPHLWGNLSAGSGLIAISRDPEFGYGFMTEFQDRLFFGTDMCSHNMANWPEVNYLKESLVKGGISQEVDDKITWKNANRALGLGKAGVRGQGSGAAPPIPYESLKVRSAGARCFPETFAPSSPRPRPDACVAPFSGPI